MIIKRKKPKDSISKFPRQHRENNYSMYKLICIMGFFIIIGLSVLIGVQHFQQLKTMEKLKEYESKAAEHRQRQSELELEIERLHENDYIEVLARERLGLVKPDEVIFQLED